MGHLTWLPGYTFLWTLTPAVAKANIPAFIRDPEAVKGSAIRTVELCGGRLVRVLASLATVLLLSGMVLFSASADEKRLTIYSNVSSYSLPVLDRNGEEYVGLLEAIEPLGSVSASADGSRWSLHYNATESEFMADSSHARIRGSDF